ncbi:carboxypeptidase regulatory-like domain-containing protein [bacterium]|nr:MAG: carboxypeptidase regulatory-like domain-containing protein [bacterium]
MSTTPYAGLSAALIAGAVLLSSPLAGLAAQHPTATVDAAVVDAHSSAPLEGAHVSIYNADTYRVGIAPFQEALANHQGEFKLKGLRLGEYRLQVSHKGYQTMAYTLEVKSNESDQWAGHLVLYPTGDPALPRALKGPCGRPMDPKQTADVYMICSGNQ